MPAHTIPSAEVIQLEILASHARCRHDGIDPLVARNPNQARLGPEELEARRKQCQEFLTLAKAQMEDLYRFVAGAGFAVTIADREGYILDLIGDQPIVGYMIAGNCCQGYRWTERDVGTSVISLVLERKIPFQVSEKEHFCKRGYAFTCSACPVFDEQDAMIGILAMSGEVQHAHPHTLGMVITAASAIENQMRILKASKELVLRNNYMTTILESIDMGVVAIDKHGIITQINNKGKQILE